jgi:hypothetical protein
MCDDVSAVGDSREDNTWSIRIVRFNYELKTWQHLGATGTGLPQCVT